MIITAFADGWMELPGRLAQCALGWAGVVAGGAKREGDGTSPAGLWPMRRVLWRPDRGPAPATRLATAPIAPDDGWCDAPDDPAYNQPVRLPCRASAERLWREDRLYDVVVVLGQNDSPVVPGAGSAIFLHLASPDFAPTQGCVALAPSDLAHLLSLARPGDAVRIRRQRRGPQS
jgi:L,D-peptidoglycan transpeptidase YkuD (ErfK/YbiS/YcfS/YnhG family)